MNDYYLQDSRSYNGNMIVWWRAGGGYTSDLSQAEKFTEQSAFNHNQSRETDIPWPCDYIDSRITKSVDMQNCDLKDALGKDDKLLRKKEKTKAARDVMNWKCCGRFVSNNEYHAWYAGDICEDCKRK